MTDLALFSLNPVTGDSSRVKHSLTILVPLSQSPTQSKEHRPCSTFETRSHFEFSVSRSEREKEGRLTFEEDSGSDYSYCETSSSSDDTVRETEISLGEWVRCSEMPRGLRDEIKGRSANDGTERSSVEVGPE